MCFIELRVGQLSFHRVGVNLDTQALEARARAFFCIVNQAERGRYRSKPFPDSKQFARSRQGQL